MLIKNYVYDRNCAPAGGKTFIIDGISEIVVHHTSCSGSENGPRWEGPNMPVCWIDQSEPTSPEDHFFFVDYTDKLGVRCRLKVTAYAYICNDEGRTVEKVGAKHTH